MKKQFLLLTLLCLSLCACSKSATPSESKPESEESHGPTLDLVVSTTKESFRIGDRLNKDDFEVKDKDGNKVTDFTVEGYDLFDQHKQTLSFYNKDQTSYGTYELTLSPRHENLKVLFLANSHADDTLTYSYRQVMSIEGMTADVHFVNNYKGGHDLQGYGNEGIKEMDLYTFNDFNLDNPYADPECRSIKYAIEQDNWDYIVLQQYTQEYHLAAQFKNITPICEYCLEHCSNKNVQFLFNMTFAYPDGTDLPLFQSKFDGSCQKLYDKIVDVCQNTVLPNEYIEAIIPMGTAIKNAMTSSLSVDDLFRDDGYPMRYEHLSLKYGRMIAGMAFVCFMTGHKAEDITYLSDKTDSETQNFLTIAQKAVNAMIDKPYETTNIG